MNDTAANPEDGTRGSGSILLVIALVIMLDDSLTENLGLRLRTFGLERTWLTSRV